MKIESVWDDSGYYNQHTFSTVDPWDNPSKAMMPLHSLEHIIELQGELKRSTSTLWAFWKWLEYMALIVEEWRLGMVGSMVYPCLIFVWSLLVRDEMIVHSFYEATQLISKAIVCHGIVPSINLWRDMSHESSITYYGTLWFVQYDNTTIRHGIPSRLVRRQLFFDWLLWRYWSSINDVFIRGEEGLHFCFFLLRSSRDISTLWYHTLP